MLALVIAIPTPVSLRPGAGNLDWFKPPRNLELLITLKELTGGGAILLVYLGLISTGLIRHW